MWIKGQPWRVANSLQRLNGQLRDLAPRAVPPATPVSSWGAIADDAHSSTSDHYPHFYVALGAVAVVCARDFPHAPSLGLDGARITEALRQSRDPRIGYVIFNRRITGPNHGWRWDHYDGDDPHDTHFHVSSVHSALADDMRAWALPGAAAASSTEENDMADFTPADVNAWHQATRIDAIRNMQETTALGEAVPIVTAFKGLSDQIRALDDLVRNLPAAQGVSVAELRDAVADLGEGGAAQVRADA